MTRTRAASLPAGVRPRLVFRTHCRTGEFSNRDTRLTADDLAAIQRAAEQLAAELNTRGAGWDSHRRTTEAGRMLTARQARRMLREVRLLEQRYYGAAVSMADLLRTAPGLTGLLSLLADELMSWVAFWDARCAEHPAGFAHDCPEPAAACPPPAHDWNPDSAELLPPVERAEQLTTAPCAPPAGIAAS